MVIFSIKKGHLILDFYFIIIFHNYCNRFQNHFYSYNLNNHYNPLDCQYILSQGYFRSHTFHFADFIMNFYYFLYFVEFKCVDYSNLHNFFHSTNYDNLHYILNFTYPISIHMYIHCQYYHWSCHYFNYYSFFSHIHDGYWYIIACCSLILLILVHSNFYELLNSFYSFRFCSLFFISFTR